MPRSPNSNTTGESTQGERMLMRAFGQSHRLARTRRGRRRVRLMMGTLLAAAMGASLALPPSPVLASLEPGLHEVTTMPTSVSRDADKVRAPQLIVDQVHHVGLAYGNAWVEQELGQF